MPKSSSTHFKGRQQYSDIWQCDIHSVLYPIKKKN